MLKKGKKEKKQVLGSFTKKKKLVSNQSVRPFPQFHTMPK